MLYEKFHAEKTFYKGILQILQKQTRVSAAARNIFKYYILFHKFSF